MSYIYYPSAKPAIRAQRSPWLSFVVLTVALFFILHWPLDLEKKLDDYNQSQDYIIQQVSAGSALRQVVLVLLGALAIASLVTHPGDRRLRMDGALGWLLVGFGAWSVMSAIWSEDPTLTIKRLAIFAILCVVAIAVVRRFSLREVVLWIFFNMALFLVVAIAVEFASGGFQPWATGYRFSGTQHPNGEGTECGILFLSALVAAKVEKRYKRLFWAFAVLGFVFLALTKSRTSLIATLIGLSVYAIAGSTLKTKKMIVPVLGMVASLILLVAAGGMVSGWDKALALGRDDVANSPDSFSGRTIIWNDVSPYIHEHPILGYGYEGFWTPTHINVISDKEEWGVPDSHSTFVDCLLTLGAVGLFLYSVSLIAGLWRVFVFYVVTRDAHFAFLGSLLVVCIVNGFFESALGEGGLLTLLSLIILFRLAYVPLNDTHPIVAAHPASLEEVCPA